MEDSVTLNPAEQQRLLVLNDLEVGIVIVTEAAELIGPSVIRIRGLVASSVTASRCPGLGEQDVGQSEGGIREECPR